MYVYIYIYTHVATPATQRFTMLSSGCAYVFAHVFGLAGLRARVDAVVIPVSGKKYAYMNIYIYIYIFHVYIYIYMYIYTNYIHILCSAILAAETALCPLHWYSEMAGK